MDSSVSETYGHQEGSAYNGHFGCICYHLLFLFNQFGDLERAMLRWSRFMNPGDDSMCAETMDDSYGRRGLSAPKLKNGQVGRF